MFDKINDTFQFHQQALSLRHERQKVLANNIANADTPGFKARDLDFSKALSSAVQRQADGTGGVLQRTSSRHLSGGGLGHDFGQNLLYRVAAQPSLDGNTVDMDQERAAFADNTVRYQTSLVMMNSYIQGLKTAIQSE